MEDAEATLFVTASDGIDEADIGSGVIVEADPSDVEAVSAAVSDTGVVAGAADTAAFEDDDHQ